MEYIDFYEQYKDKIFSYLFYNLGKDTALAEDLTSDTFLKGFEKFESYDTSLKFSTWIFTIARNTLYDHYRKHKIDIGLDETSEITFEEFLKYEEDFDAKIDTDIKMNQVYNLIEKIPKNQKDIIIMKYIQEFSTQEISDMTGKSQATIRKTLSRGLHSLSNMLHTLTS